MEFEMTLAEAIVVQRHLGALGYPNPRHRELLALCGEKIVAAQDDVYARFVIFKNTPEQSGTARKAPSTIRDGASPGDEPVAVGAAQPAARLSPEVDPYLQTK